MTHPILWPVWAFLLLWALWVFFLAVMTLKRAKDAEMLTTSAKCFGYPVLFIGLLLDFLANVLVLTVLLVELPREGTVTSRLKRHNAAPVSSIGWRAALQRWRKAVAAWAEPLLDPFDPSGDHI